MRYLSRAKKAALVVATVMFASLLTVAAPAAASEVGVVPGSDVVPSSAASLIVTAPPIAVAGTAPAPQAAVTGGTVTGKITSGLELTAPLAVLYTPNEPSGYKRWKSDSKHYAFADETGSFSIAGVPAGTYTAVFVDYDDESIAPRYYGGTYNITQAKSFKVTTNGTVTGIDGVLEAGVTVSGKVTNGSGAALKGATAQVARQITVDGNPFWEYVPATTGPDGAYSVQGLAPGTFAVRALGPSGQGYSDAFYGGGNAFERSTTFSLTSGASKSGVNVKLTKKLTVGTPKISGTAAVGSTLKAATGTWTKGTKFTYQWYADGKAISKATKSSYKLTKSQKAKKITVKVTGANTDYATGTKTSKATAKVATAATPKISGSAKVGKKLTAKPGTWTKGTKYTYRWYANGKAISKATKSTLTLTKSHKGKKITVKVTGKKSGYATVSKTSKATKKVG